MQKNGSNRHLKKHYQDKRFTGPPLKMSCPGTLLRKPVLYNSKKVIKIKNKLASTFYKSDFTVTKNCLISEIYKSKSFFF